MKKIIIFCKKYFREILFAIATIVFAAGIRWIEPAWCAITLSFFAELIAGQMLTRTLVYAQIKAPDDIQGSLPRAHYLTALGFFTLAAIFAGTYDGVSFLIRSGIGLFSGILFWVLYWMETESDRKRYQAFIKMSVKEWHNEMEKIKKAEKDIQRAQEVLQNSPLY